MRCVLVQDGQNLRVIYRWSTGKRELIDQYVGELVALKPDVILANSTPVITAFKGMTSSIPVVFALSMDPVGLGHVKSLSHPGGNFTGFTFVDPELVGKWMQLLKDVVPGLTQAALLYNPQTTPAYNRFVEQIRAAYGSRPIEMKAMPVANVAEMETAINALAKTADALPAFGIVAAVMGVVHTMESVGIPPAELGKLIAAALVGTFLGILLSYGFVGPLSVLLEHKLAESTKMLQCVKVTLLASLNGYAPQVAVEFGRKVLYSTERPSFMELEDEVKQRKAH